MSVINIVVPPLQRRTFSGGILCVLEYAKGLFGRGHQVNVVPLLPSPDPLWVKGRYGRLIGARDVRDERASNGVEGQRDRAFAVRAVREVIADAGVRYARLLPQEVQRGFQMRHVRRIMPAADVTLATSFETALPVHLYGSGRRFYFAQHFEPYFAMDLSDPVWAEHEALASYGLGLNMIVNSTWLRTKMRQTIGVEAALCPNAIDHEVFFPARTPRTEDEEIRIISYGGRRATWKGFQEMAAAVRVVREALPHRTIRWQVYGESLLTPENSPAAYEPLGFLDPPALAEAYRRADILLSASWYESFPLFPLEGMACGLAVVTTQTGAEEFAFHERTAEVVRARDVRSIANGLRRVIEEPDYRRQLGRNGREIAGKFRWRDAVERMERVLLSDGPVDDPEWLRETPARAVEAPAPAQTEVS